ncbi:MAG: hypothetical protein IPK97_01170 [Ahniella sp.]|nr:hypothetical protein [Ahniella sp.]
MRSSALDPEITCTQGEMECVAKARKLRVLLAAELRLQTAALATAERVVGAEEVRAPGPELMAEFLTEWPGSRAVLNNIALRFVDGDTLGAEADLCRHVASWRRLRAESPHLQITRLALPILADAAALHAEMRSELPADAPLAEDCEQAFSPLSVRERSLCPLMAGELALAEHLLTVDMRAAAQSERDRLGGLGQRVVNLGTQPEPTLDLLALQARGDPVADPVVTEPSFAAATSGRLTRSAAAWWPTCPCGQSPCVRRWPVWIVDCG